MGVVCCEVSPQLAHEENKSSGLHDPLSEPGTTTTALAATLQSDHDGPNAAFKPTSAIDQAKDIDSTQDNELTKTPQATKKRVRINDEVTLIPLLTSASFFRKTPKPTITTSHSHGIMPSFRIVTPATDQVDSSDDMVQKSSLWWTKEEKKEILQANQKASRDFKRFQPTKMREANLVYSDIVNDCNHRHDECQHSIEHHDDDDDIYDFFRRQRASGTSATAASRTKKRKRSEICSVVQDGSDRSELPNLTIDLPTNVRGLEWGVLPDAKRYRKDHAKTVLRWQDRFRRMNERRRKQPRKIHWDSTESSSSSSSGTSSDEDEDFENSTTCEKTTRYQQDLLLAKKASISSQRSTILARLFGKSDELAANPHELEEGRKHSRSPTPSLTGSESSESDENDESGSDEESDSDEQESDSDTDSDDESEDESQHSFRSISYPGGYYTSKLQSNGNFQRPRMFRPRMMPPTSWR